MQTLSDFLRTTIALDMPGTYEFYELQSPDGYTRRFIIKNIINGRSILVKSERNKLLIDSDFINYNNINGRKISIIRFFEKLNGIGIKYLNEDPSAYDDEMENIPKDNKDRK